MDLNLYNTFKILTKDTLYAFKVFHTSSF